MNNDKINIEAIIAWGVLTFGCIWFWIAIARWLTE